MCICGREAHHFPHGPATGKKPNINLIALTQFVFFLFLSMVLCGAFAFTFHAIAVVCLCLW